MNHPGNKSPKPLNWTAPTFEEPVEKSVSLDSEMEAYFRKGTPMTRRGMYRGAMPGLQPNAHHPDLNPPLILKADGKDGGVGPRGGKIKGRTASGRPLYQSQVPPGAHHPLTHGQHGDDLPARSDKEPDEDDEQQLQSQIDALAQQIAQGSGRPPTTAAEHAPGGGGSSSAPGGSPSDSGGDATRVQHAQGGPHGSGEGMKPPQGGGGAQAPQQQMPHAGPAAQAKPPGMGPAAMQQQQHQPMMPQDPRIGQDPYQMQHQPTPIGYTSDNTPIFSDPFHPQHQMFQKPQHLEAAQAAQQAGDSVSAQAHQQLAQDKASPMDRAQEKMSANPNDMMSTTPAGGRNNLPGQDVPNPFEKPQTEPQLAPGAPQAPGGEMGQERQGPKPGMVEKPMPTDGAPMLAQPQQQMPPSLPEAGFGPNAQMGGQQNAMQALQQWMLAQMASTGQAAPGPGSATQQQTQGIPKPIGMGAPATHAGYVQRKEPDVAQKSLIESFDWSKTDDFKKA